MLKKISILGLGGSCIKMSIAMLLMMLLSLNVSAGEEENYVLLDSGEEVLLIDVDKHESLNDRKNVNQNLQTRVRNLEQAVRALQKRIYNLEGIDNEPQSKRYTCQFRSCRQSTSIHNANRRNCNFYNMWRDDGLRVWGRNTQEAERNVVEAINKSSDIKHHVSNSISCRRG